MIIQKFYLSNDNNLELTKELTGLSEDEILELTGRFAKHSHRAGNIRGELVKYIDGKIVIRDGFKKCNWWDNGISEC